MSDSSLLYLHHKRAHIACSNCRRRKIKCIPSRDSGETRCQQCSKRGLRCEYIAVSELNTPLTAAPACNPTIPTRTARVSQPMQGIISPIPRLSRRHEIRPTQAALSDYPEAIPTQWTAPSLQQNPTHPYTFYGPQETQYTSAPFHTGSSTHGLDYSLAWSRESIPNESTWWEVPNPSHFCNCPQGLCFCGASLTWSQTSV
ncbi:hypothetical protein C8R43DRAFT_1009709 [Mycena crocata]|nr:hypothetical protein C8R43DRAFT_1009709 [Mycena crocata]